MGRITNQHPAWEIWQEILQEMLWEIVLEILQEMLQEVLLPLRGLKMAKNADVGNF